jgi:aerobic-type carbon monoxide dehydrogenase small subunit (CoxS/CutS family)
MQITVSVNGEEHTREVEPRLLLVHLLLGHVLDTARACAFDQLVCVVGGGAGACASRSI